MIEANEKVQRQAGHVLVGPSPLCAPPASWHDPGWISWLVPGCDLELINEYYFFWLGSRLGGLDLLMEDMDPSKAIVILYSARQALDKLIQTKFAKVPMCAEAGLRLDKTLKRTIAAFEQDVLHRAIEAGDLLALHEDRNSFDEALSIQLRNFQAYRVTPKGALDTQKLIGDAGASFTEKEWADLPDIAKSDWSAGARCLAFALPTACGFHVIRAVEAVVKFYLAAIQVAPLKRDLGYYATLLADNGADARVVRGFDDIRRLDRNPLIHPEHTLEIEEAMDLFDLCKSAIKALLRDMDKRGLL